MKKTTILFLLNIVIFNVLNTQNSSFPPASMWPPTVFAPFVDATAYPIPKLSEIAQKIGVKYFILGFVVSKANQCALSWGGYYDLDKGPSSWGNGKEEFLYDELKKLRGMGGDFMISIGGANGMAPAAMCGSAAELKSLYEKLLDQFALNRLDFDIEGTWLTDTHAIEKHNQALAQVQQSRKNLVVWLTLPVLPQGLADAGMNVIRSALKNNVMLTGINIMAMDYGDNAAPNPQGKMGSYAIQAMTSLKNQLQTIYKEFGKNLNDQEAWRMVGVTPMIGLNDVTTEHFTLQDAQQVVDFAKQHNISLIGMWSIGRDKPCTDTTVSTKCSSTPDQKEDYQFARIFNVFTKK